jgi:FtsH-binding integral membrane protein
MPIDLRSVPAARLNPARIDSEAALRDYMRGIYNYMTGGLLVTGAVAYLAYVSGFYQAIAGTPLVWLVLLAPLGIVFFLGARINSMSLAAAQATYWIYSALVGLSLASIFLRYTGQSLSQVFLITAGTFGGMSLYGYTTKTDLTRFGSFLLMGLFGVIIAGLVNLFLHSSALQFAVSVMGVIVFVGLTAYDTQKIKAMFSTEDSLELRGKKAVMGALELYLDFLNLFLMLLRLFGGRRS